MVSFYIKTVLFLRSGVGPAVPALPLKLQERRYNQNLRLGIKSRPKYDPLYFRHTRWHRHVKCYRLGLFHSHVRMTRVGLRSHSLRPVKNKRFPPVFQCRAPMARFSACSFPVANDFILFDIIVHTRGPMFSLPSWYHSLCVPFYSDGLFSFLNHHSSV